MMLLPEACAAMAGELHGGDGALTGVSTDSRRLAPGDLFFALKGEKFDAARLAERLERISIGAARANERAYLFDGKVG